MEIRSPALKGANSIYLSAGIHGDEPAGPAGLYEWAFKHEGTVSSLPLILYPCLNPWGLINNSRLDADGVDLNRIWGQPNHPLVNMVRRSLGRTELLLSLQLHEDFDGQGIYLYEPSRGGKPDDSANLILDSAKHLIGRDFRSKIDGRKARDGIIRPRPRNLPAEGMPEAIFLLQKKHHRNFTIETPSEFSFDLRKSAHLQMIDQAVRIIKQ